MVEKLIRNGEVAVIYSAGYGAGWSTWNENSEAMLFDPEIAQAIVNKAALEEVSAIATRKYPDAYQGGLEDVGVEWVPVGTRFVIREYDGSEHLEILGPDYGYVA